MLIFLIVGCSKSEIKNESVMDGKVMSKSIVSHAFSRDVLEIYMITKTGPVIVCLPVYTYDVTIKENDSLRIVQNPTKNGILYKKDGFLKVSLDENGYGIEVKKNG